MKKNILKKIAEWLKKNKITVRLLVGLNEGIAKYIPPKARDRQHRNSTNPKIFLKNYQKVLKSDYQCSKIKVSIS